MSNFEVDDTYTQDNLFVEIKTEAEEFIKVLKSQPIFAELQPQIETIYQSLSSYYSNVNLVQRQLLDTKAKLKANLKNKTEVTKSIEDDLERYESIKKETENINFKIDENKFKEEEKEKLIADQKLEIARLGQKKDQESLANLRPQDVARKQELINQSEAYEMDYKELLDKKKQKYEMVNNLTNERIAAEKLGEQRKKELSDLENEKKKLDKQIDDAKQKKAETDLEFKKKKDDFNNIDKKLLELQKEGEMLNEEQKNLNSKKENKENEKRNLENAITELQSKKIPQLNSEKYDNEEKKKKTYDLLKELNEEMESKNKEKLAIVKETGIFNKRRFDYDKKIKETQAQLNAVEEKAKNKREETMNIEDEIRQKENEFTAKKSELTKNQKVDATINQQLEKLSEQVYEINNQIKALNSSNHRMEVKIHGMKNETLALDKEQSNAEKEKNLCAKLASDANMDHTQALEKLKKLNEAIAELKQKNVDSESKLKQIIKEE